MADYWKSNPRRMCEICKVWMADNKISIDIHERGKKHKEMAQKRIVEARKKGAQEIHDRDEVKRQLAALEKAAMQAYEKDRLDDPTLPRSRMHRPVESVGSVTAHQTTMSGDHLSTAQMAASGSASYSHCQWAAYTTGEGHVYYHNHATGESTWEKPADFVEEPPTDKESCATDESGKATDDLSGLEERQETEEKEENSGSEGPEQANSTNEVLTEKQAGTKDSNAKEDERHHGEKEQKAGDEKNKRKRPWQGSGRDRAFGGWTTVSISAETVSSIKSDHSRNAERHNISSSAHCATEEKNPEEKTVFDMSDDDEDLSEMLKFGERTVSSLEQADAAGSGTGLFKKRKRAGTNIRKRTGTPKAN